MKLCKIARSFPSLFISLIFCTVIAETWTATANDYVKFSDKPIWSYWYNGRLTIIVVKEKQRVQDNEYYPVEWHLGEVKDQPFKTEYWLEKGDSIFCAGAKMFGREMLFKQPFFIVANTTKPGDSWLRISNPGAFTDTTICKADFIDSTTIPHVTALRISKIMHSGKGSIAYYWMEKGRGLVMESSN